MSFHIICLFRILYPKKYFFWGSKKTKMMHNIRNLVLDFKGGIFMKGYVILDANMKEIMIGVKDPMQFELLKRYSKGVTQKKDSLNPKNSFLFIPNFSDVHFFIKNYADLYEGRMHIFEVNVDGRIEKYLYLFRTSLAEEIQVVRKLDEEEWDTEEMRKAAVQTSGRNIRFFPDASAGIRILAIHRDESAKEFIDMPTEEELATAIIKNPYLICKISSPSKDLQKVAVMHDGMALRCITDPDEEIKELAIKSNWRAMHFIKNPSPQLQELAISLNEGAKMIIKIHS